MIKRYYLALVLVILLFTALISGCTTTVQQTTTTATTTTITTTTTTTTVTTEAACDTRATAIAGIVTYDMPQGTDTRYYCMYAPPGSSELGVTLYDFNGDFDLYLLHGSYDDIVNGDYDFSSKAGSQNWESILLVNPAPGYYYAAVVDYDGLGGSYTFGPVIWPDGPVTTTPATTDTGGCDSRAISISPMTDVVGSFQADDEFKYYCVNIPDGIPRVGFALTGFDNDLNLYVGYGSYSSIMPPNYPNWGSIAIGEGNDEVLVISDPLPGNYYIVVYNYDELAGSFSLTVEI